MAGEFRFNDADGFGNIVPFHKEDAVNIQDVIDLFQRETSAFQAYGVHAHIGKRFAGSFYIRRHIFAYQRTAGYKGMVADLDRTAERLPYLPVQRDRPR